MSRVTRKDPEFKDIIKSLSLRHVMHNTSGHDVQNLWHKLCGPSDGGSNNCDIESLELLHYGSIQEFWAIRWDHSDDNLNYAVVVVSA